MDLITRAQGAPQSVGGEQAQPTVKHAAKRQKLKYALRAWKEGLGQGEEGASWPFWA